MQLKVSAVLLERTGNIHRKYIFIRFYIKYEIAYEIVWRATIRHIDYRNCEIIQVIENRCVRFATVLFNMQTSVAL